MTKQLGSGPHPGHSSRRELWDPSWVWQNSGSPMIKGVASLQTQGPQLPVVTMPQPGLRAPFCCHIPSEEVFRADQVSREDSKGWPIGREQLWATRLAAVAVRGDQTSSGGAVEVTWPTGGRAVKDNQDGGGKLETTRLPGDSWE